VPTRSASAPKARREFFGIAHERGRKAAFKWRDEKFAVA
jgi:hypothetical protein